MKISMAWAEKHIKLFSFISNQNEKQGIAVSLMARDVFLLKNNRVGESVEK